MCKLKRYLSCLFFSFVVIQSLNAQTNEIGSWLVYFGNQKIDNKWNIQSDFQYRNHQVLSQRNQYLLRAGVGYNLKEQNHNLLLGFAYIATDSYDEVNTFKATRFESRIYQQYLYKHRFGKTYVNHRVRLEERFLANEFGLRGRYFISMQKPFKGKDITKHSSYFSTYNELFIDIKNAQFDRNRLYVGLGYGITEHIRIETGYMIQAQKNINRGQLQFILINNLPF
jgi:hypothetical protein